MNYLDIALFAFIAVFLLVRLWRTFGTKDENETQRPNPFATPAPRREEETPREDIVIRPGMDAQERAAALNAENRRQLLNAPPPNSLVGVLQAIRKQDKTFDEKNFLHGAKSAFGMIVQAFAAGDQKTLQGLLAARVMTQFEAAITRRAAAKQTQETAITAIKDAEIVAADLVGTRAAVTVKFTSEQINLLRDQSGTVLEGDPKKAERVEDIWTFTRDTTSGDPHWLLSETKS